MMVFAALHFSFAKTLSKNTTIRKQRYNIYKYNKFECIYNKQHDFFDR